VLCLGFFSIVPSKSHPNFDAKLFKLFSLRSLEKSFLVRSIHPLFSRVLQREESYLANHSLGRPLDQTATDVQQALALWYDDMDGAWDHWLAEIQSFRGRAARLIHAPREDCIIPKSSAGQGLRAIRELKLISSKF